VIRTIKEAVRAGVNPVTVYRMRASVFAKQNLDAKSADIQTRKGKDGKNYPAHSASFRTAATPPRSKTKAEQISRIGVMVGSPVAAASRRL
jgi:hypothetical protein